MKTEEDINEDMNEDFDSGYFYNFGKIEIHKLHAKKSESI